MLCCVGYVAGCCWLEGKLRGSGGLVRRRCSPKVIRMNLSDCSRLSDNYHASNIHALATKLAKKLREPIFVFLCSLV